ncbi:MAG: pyruvate kinase alpha/beta domain-containing protein, partial [Ferrimonas sp.]
GVTPLAFDVNGSEVSEEELVSAALERVKATGHLQAGDIVLLTKGDMMDTIGGTNTCKIVQIPA